MKSDLDLKRDLSRVIGNISWILVGKAYLDYRDEFFLLYLWNGMKN
jgi:hypothetical protein